MFWVLFASISFLAIGFLINTVVQHRVNRQVQQLFQKSFEIFRSQGTLNQMFIERLGEEQE